jgi:hypothetical protein
VCLKLNKTPLGGPCAPEVGLSELFGLLHNEEVCNLFWPPCTIFRVDVRRLAGWTLGLMWDIQGKRTDVMRKNFLKNVRFEDQDGYGMMS